MLTVGMLAMKEEDVVGCLEKWEQKREELIEGKVSCRVIRFYDDAVDDHRSQILNEMESSSI